MAQDIHFSQFNENHALVNPALTGATDPLRASLSYRDQWRSVSTPYKTFGMSFETQLNTSGWKAVDKFRSMTFKERSIGRLAWGLSVYSDRAGAGRLATTQGNFSMATFVPLNKKNFISVGLQASYVQKNINNGDLIFPSQFNGMGYDPNLPKNERMIAVNYNYAGFAGGVLWSYGQKEKRIASNNQVKANAGFSVYHISPPHKSFFADKRSLMTKYVLHGDMLIAPANVNTAIAPSFLVQMQGTSTEIMLGAMFKYYVADNSKYTGNVKRSAIGMGAYYRNRDAIITAVNLEVEEQFVIGLSYDVNTSRLTSVSTGRGAFEIALRYTPPNAFLYQKKAKIAK